MTSQAANNMTGTSTGPQQLEFKSVDEALRFGLSRHAAGAVGEAAEVYRQLLTVAPRNPDVLRLYGLARTQSGQPEQGLPYLEQAVRLAPKHPLAHMHQGLALLALKRYREAANAFREAARLNHRDPAPRLNLSSALLELNRPSEALTVARKVIELAPSMAEGWNNVGLALLALHQHGPARDSFAAAVERRQDFADAWLNLGKAEKDLGRIVAAENAYLKALGHQPNLVGAALNLANLRLERGREEEAETLYRQVLERVPDHPEAHVGLASVLLQREQADEALALIDRVKPSAKMRAHWIHQRAVALDQLDREDEALSVLDEARGEDAQDLGILSMRLRMNLRREPEQAPTLVKDIEARLAEPQGLTFEARLAAHFGLGDFWHKQEDPERAFGQWQTGHEMLTATEPFSLQAYKGFTTAVKEHFNAERLHNGPNSQIEDPTPVFIVGMPRSGTTLVEQILDSHPDIFGAGELTDIPRLFDQLGGGHERASAVPRVAAQSSEALSEHAEAHLKRLRELAPQTARITDKLPHNFHYLGLIALLFPGARVIYCQRDPRDVCFSIFRRRFLGHHNYAHRLTDLAQAYLEHHRLMEHWQAVLPLRFHTVRYQALVDDFEQQVCELLDFVEVPFNERSLRFHENTRRVHTASREQVRRPLYRSGLGQWRPYAQWLQPLCEILDQARVLPAEEA